MVEECDHVALGRNPGMADPAACLVRNFPTGYSRRFRPPTSPTTARLPPSGDQSAHCTFSSISRGAPPANGALASVPTLTHVPVRWLFRATAISPEGETARS